MITIIFAACLLVVSYCSSAEPGGGGFLEEKPSWFVEVKTSERPFVGAPIAAWTTGSGSWIARDLVLTCWHNYRDSWKKGANECYIEDHEGNRYDIEIAAINKSADVMILRVTDDIIATHTQVRISTESRAYGTLTNYGMNRGGKGFRWTTGEVRTRSDGSNVQRGTGGATMPWNVHTGLIVQGMSGGPAFNDEGELCGVNIHGEGVDSTFVSLETIQALLDKVQVED